MICRADCCAYSGRSAVWPAVGKFGWRPAWLVDQCLAGRVGASAGCAPTAWLAKARWAAGCLACPGLSFQAAFHRVAQKNKLVFDLVGQAFTAGILHRWQSTLGINKKEGKNRSTTVRLPSNRTTKTETQSCDYSQSEGEVTTYWLCVQPGFEKEHSIIFLFSLPVY